LEPAWSGSELGAWSRLGAGVSLELGAWNELGAWSWLGAGMSLELGAWNELGAWSGWNRTHTGPK